MGGPHTLNILERFPNVPRFQDFRKMFNAIRNQNDAVTVGTTDHSNFPVTMIAISLWKHIYFEKPLARTLMKMNY